MSTTADRALVMLGIVPLAAAGLWLTLLRRPECVAAHAMRTPPAANRDEASAEPRPHFLGVVLAGQSAELGAELAGEVVHVFGEPGARVKRGDPLLQLTALSVAGAQTMASAQAAEDRSSLEAARLTLASARDKAQRMASASHAFAERDLAAARADAARAAAELARLQGSAGLHRVAQQRELARADKQLVRAPFDGVLAARFVDLGDFVHAGQLLARVVDDTRFVRFALPGPDRARLRVGDTLRIEPDAAIAVLSADVVDIDPELDSAAGLGLARAALHLDGALVALLPPGTRVHVVAPATQLTRRGVSP